MLKDEEINVWECKVIIPADQLPPTFDLPMRTALEQLLKERGGVDCLGISSGWGGRLTKMEKQAYSEVVGDFYLAGFEYQDGNPDKH